MVMEITEKQIIIQNRMVTYYVSPNVSAKPYLFLHGWGSNSTLWFNSLKNIISEKYCLFVDLPGFGKSEIPAEPWNLAEYVNFVALFLKKLGLSKVELIGHSFGGSIAIKLALENPELVSRLILVDSAGVRSKNRRKTFIKSISQFIKPIFKIGFLQNVRRKIYHQIGSDYLELPLMHETYKKIISEDLSEILSSVKIPTSIIWGSDDQATPLADAELMKRKISDSQLHIISHAGHFCFLDQPVKFADELNHIFAIHE
jgi:pimeloyl-ACP methyl ester carboxylesterase